MQLTYEENLKLLTLVNAEIMKANLHYGATHKHTEAMYNIRDKILEDVRNGK